MNKPLLLVSVVGVLAANGFFSRQMRWRDVAVAVPNEHYQIASTGAPVTIPVRIVNRTKQDAIADGCLRTPRLHIEREIAGTWREHLHIAEHCASSGIIGVVLPAHSIREAMVTMRAPGRYRVRFFYRLQLSEPGSPEQTVLSKPFEIAPASDGQ